MGSDAPRSRRTPAEMVFHVGLAGALVPLLSAPALWLATIVCFRYDGGARHRLFTWRVLALAIVDTLVAVTLVASFATGIVNDMLRSEPPPVMIGVVVEETPDAGLRVLDVMDGSPADEAGVLPGDVVSAVDGASVDTREQLASRLAVNGGQAELAIERVGERGAESLEVVVAPSETLRASAVQQQRCDDVLGTGGLPSELEVGAVWRGLLPYAVVLCFTIGLWIVGRMRRVPQAGMWLPFLGLYVVASVIGSFGLWLGCTLAGATYALETALVIGEVSLTVIFVGWWLLARRRGAIVEMPPGDGALPLHRAYGLGLFYMVAWMIRVAILSIPLVWLSQELGVGAPSAELTELLSGNGDALQAGLVFVAAVVLAPVAEEVLFRGLILPHLARYMSPWWAIALTAILFGSLHVAHGVNFVGPLTLGVVFGWARWRTGSIGAPILLHTTVNGFASVLSWLA